MTNHLMSVNQSVVGKSLPALKAHNEDFVNVLDVLDNEDIMDIVSAHGFATASILKENGNRDGDNVVGARVFQLDFDNTWTIEEAVQHELFDYCIGIYTTPSNGKNQDPLTDDQRKKMQKSHIAEIEKRVNQPMSRFRMVFVAEDVIPAQDMRDFYIGLFQLFPMADDSCKDSARLFFGSKNADERYDNPAAKRMDKELVEMLINLGKEINTDAKYEFGTGNGVAAGVVQGNRFHGNIRIMMGNRKVTDADTLLASMPKGYNNRKPCFSPFRSEKNPSAWLMRTDHGYLVINDTASGQRYVYSKKGD